MPAVGIYVPIQTLEEQGGLLPSADDITAEDHAALSELEQTKQLAERIGMPALAKADERRLLRPIRERYVKQLGLQSVSGDYGVWMEWLPTVYRTDCIFNSDTEHPWENYSFDNVPIPVRQLIAVLKEQGVFDRLVIRTPERSTRTADPALFGRIGDAIYLLARWGESDEKLRSFEEIRQGVRAVRKEGNCGSIACWTCCLGTAACVIIGLFIGSLGAGATGGVMPPWSGLLWWALGGIILLAGSIGGFFGYYRRRKIRKNFAYAFVGR